MLIHNVWGEINSRTENPSLRFFLMFIGVVPGTLLLLATGVHNFGVLRQPGLAWSFLVLAILVVTSVVLGCWRVGQTPATLSILALPWITRRRK